MRAIRHIITGIEKNTMTSIVPTDTVSELETSGSFEQEEGREGL